MAINVADNFSYKGSKPLDARVKYETVAAMAGAATADLYDGCLAYVTATKKYYSYDSTNTTDPTTGKWREYSSGGGSGADTKIIADDFDATEPYAVGAYVVYEGVLYKCTTAHTGAWDASDFDATQVMDEMPTPMPAADMSDIVSPLPSVMSRRFKYSTEEQVVGKWIDGKPLYQKTFNLSNNVKGSEVQIDVSDLDIDKMVDMHGLYNRVLGENDELFIPFCDYYSGSYNSYIHYRSGSKKLQILINASETTNVQIVTIQYTKTTD